MTATSAWAFDLETDKIQPGLPAPPPVIGSVATPAKGTERILTAAEIVPWLNHEIDKSLFLMANGAYDWGVVCTYWPEFTRRVFQAYEEGRVFDVQIAQMLDAIAKGHLFIDPRTGGGLKDPRTGKPGRYSLSICTDLVLGRSDAKANDWARMRYSLFRGVPLEHWPAHAEALGCPDPLGPSQYPLDDARNQVDVAVGQRKHENIHQMAAQARAAWCLHLGSMWGRRTDPVAVANLKTAIDAKYAQARKDFTEVGLFDKDGEENQIAKKKRVAIAYGATGSCKACSGSGSVISTKSGKPIQCKTCSATGVDLTTAPNLKLTSVTPKGGGGGICADRDVLSESGDDVLEAYAGVSNVLKVKNTYLPMLELGTKQRINFRPNVLLENGRTSYDGLIQLIPRDGFIRECFVAPPGSVLCSTDFPAMEMTTLAQVLYWILGWSSLRDAVNAKMDLHSLFGAKLTGMTYEAFLALVEKKDEWAVGIRQACKAGNFGFPGYMGAARFVTSKRAQEGLRVCISLGRAPKCEICQGAKDQKCKRCYGRGYLCGLEKVTSWNNRKTSPACKLCLELTEFELKKGWFEQWSEMDAYFKYIKSACGGPLGGKLKQFVSNRWRGNLGVPDAANTLFSGLAADAAKHALWLVSKAAYTDENSPLWETRPLELLHDDISSEMFEHKASEAGWEQARLCDVALAEYCPDMTPKKVEPALMRRWSKKAETVIKDGKLVPWEPKRKPGEVFVWESAA